MIIYPCGDKKDCSGCGACVNVCPCDAITMQEDEYGFSYPCVEQSKCIDCKKCVKACANAQSRELRLPLEVYAATNKNRDTLLKSSSGGVFSALAEVVLSMNGAVCGCVYDENLMPVHVCTEKEDGICLMRKSKYAQSNVGVVYREVFERLKRGQLVLFTGTPCQVGALYSVVGDGFANLITVDLICHGVPSSAMFKQFLNYLEEKYKTKIAHFDFRSKKYKWQRYTAEFAGKDGKVKNIGKMNEFYFSAFSTGNILRPNCFECRYACPERVGDITVGDFWGHAALELRCDKNNGISIVAFNTEKVQKLIGVLEEKLILDKVDYQVAVAGNTCLQHPTIKGDKWDTYMQAMKNGEISLLAKRYRQKNKKRILRSTVKNLLPISVIHFINKRRYKK